MNRRYFLKQSGLLTASLSPLLRVTAGGLALGSGIANASAPAFNDYKVLVIVNLNGGNDAMSMFPPTASTPHGQYETIRGSSEYEPDNIAISNANLDDEGASNSLFTREASGHYVKNNGTIHPYYDAPQTDDRLQTSAVRSYRKGCYHANADASNNGTTPTGLGINSMMPELAAMYKKGKVSFVSNVGTLVKPTSKAAHGDNLDQNDAELPVFLFAHNHQITAVQTAQAEQIGTTGWAGRVADAWALNAPVGLNISYSNKPVLLVGGSTSPIQMPTGAPVSFNTAYIFPNQTRGDAVERVIERFQPFARNNPFSKYYADNLKRAGDLSTLLTTAMSNAPDFSTFTTKNTYGQNLFSVPDMANVIELLMHDELRNPIFKQLEAAAKMVKVGKDELGYKRQILYVSLPVFDTHTNQTAGHASSLRSVSLALSDFQKALEEMNLDDQVLTVSISEFGRSLLNSGDGTSHGWGGHSFMMTGDSTFNGGNVFGTVMDDLSLDGVNGYTEKGRIIPTTSIEQMMAPALKWFGVDESLMATVLPNLSNFETTNGDYESAFLQNVFT